MGHKCGEPNEIDLTLAHGSLHPSLPGAQHKYAEEEGILRGIAATWDTLLAKKQSVENPDSLTTLTNLALCLVRYVFFF